MTALRKPTPGRMTVAEFLDWSAENHSREHWQLVDGSPVAMAPANETHAMLQIEIGRRIANHLEATGRPCRIGAEAGVVPRVRAATNVRIPDLAVTCAPPSRDRTLSEPLILIEIVSPSNEEETRTNVWSYTTIPSVMEIVLVSSTTVSAELLRRRPDKSWPEHAVPLGAEDTFELSSIGFSAALRALYRTTALA